MPMGGMLPLSLTSSASCIVRWFFSSQALIAAVSETVWAYVVPTIKMYYKGDWSQSVLAGTLFLALLWSSGLVSAVVRLLALATLVFCPSHVGALVTATLAAGCSEGLAGVEVASVGIQLLMAPVFTKYNASAAAGRLGGQLLAIAVCMEMRGSGRAGLWLYSGLSGIALFICCTYTYISKQQRILKDSIEETQARKDQITFLKHKHQSFENSLSVRRSRALEVKLRRLFPGRLRTSRHLSGFPLTGGLKRTDVTVQIAERLFLAQSEDRQALSLESEPDSFGSLELEQSDSPDISGEDLDALATSVLSNEYLSWSQRKNKKPDIAKDKFIQMLTQSRDVKLRSDGRHFRRDFVKLKSTLEENPDLSEIFDRLCEWDFSAFDLLKVTSEPLREVGAYVFSALNLSEQFSISRITLTNFLARIEKAYHRDNYYHNSLHATDVLNSVYFLLYSGVHSSGQFLELEVLALVVSALAHDVAHPGLNNAFLINSGDALAVAYNDKSVLEMMHCSMLFSILKKPDSNILRGLSNEDLVSFRKISIAVILATDLQRHFEKVSEFKAALDRNQQLAVAEFRMLTMEICLKCADIGHCAKELDLHKRWTSLLAQELFLQGDKESSLGLPVSPLCNRETLVLCKSQVSFITAFVQPLYLQWEELVRRAMEGRGEDKMEVTICLQHIRDNLLFWECEGESLDHGQPVFTIIPTKPPLQVISKRLSL